MSDTYRWVHPTWDEDHPHWPVDGQFGNKKPTQSRKHQCRDRHDGMSQRSKKSRFSKYTRNTQYNLERKIDDLRLRENLSDLE